MSSFDWGSFWGGVIAAAGSVFIGYVALFASKRKDKTLVKIDAVRVADRFVRTLGRGVQKLNDGYVSSDLTCLADAIEILNTSYMEELESLIPEIALASPALLNVAIETRKGGIDIRDEFTEPLRSDPQKLWSDDTRGIAQLMISRIMEFLVIKHSESVVIQKRLLDNLSNIHKNRSSDT